MRLENFRILCANDRVTNQELLAHIMELKRADVKFTDAEKNEIGKILQQSGRQELAKKIGRNLERHRKK